MKDKARRGIVGVEDNNIPKGGHILHGQYNTRHAVSAIPNEICGKIRRQPSQSKVQQKPEEEIKLIRDMRWRNPTLGLILPEAAGVY